MIRDAIARVTEKKNLDAMQTHEVFLEIFSRKATPSQIAAFLVGLKAKGETYEEISAAAKVIRSKAIRLNIPGGEPVFDTCGTGGSKTNKFNISTAVAFVVTASGAKVAKHGNRAMSSTCGSADVLEAMGININASGHVMQEAIEKIGIGFLYAPLYHPAFKIVSPVRKEIGIRTIFNILGPLCNPAFANYQLLGVFSPDLMLKMAKALKILGSKRAFVVFGKDLKDEVSLTGKTQAVFLNNKMIKKIVISPSHFGLKRCELKDLEVKDARESAGIILDVFKGKNGPCQDIILANASVSFYILKKVKNFKEGVCLAKKLLKQGKVYDKFLKFKDFLDEKHSQK